MKLVIVSMVLLFAWTAFAFGQRVEKSAQVRGRVTTLWGEPVKQASDFSIDATQQIVGPELRWRTMQLDPYGEGRIF